MEAAYGIGVQNRYALFMDEDEGADPFAKAAVAIGGDKKVAVAGKTTNKPQQQAQQGKPLTESKSNTGLKDAGRQNQRLGNNKTVGGQQQQQQIKPVNRENQENRNADRSPRGNKFYENSNDDLAIREGKEVRRNFGNNHRGPRQFNTGTGGKFDNQRSGKRDFNRHSGSDKTGVKAQDKREGSGSYNWGKATDDAEADHTEAVNGEATGEEGAEKQADSGKVGETEGEGAVADAEAPKEDEEPPTKTLDEYKREIEEKRMHTQFNIRKPGEGEDKSKWKKTYVLKKKAELYEDEVEYEEIEVEEDPNKRRNRKVLDIDISFRPSDEGRDFGGRRGRGGRGGPAGDRAERGGGGGERGDRAPRDRPPREAGRTPRGGGQRGPSGRGGRFQSAPKFDDPNDFPSLG